MLFFSDGLTSKYSQDDAAIEGLGDEPYNDRTAVKRRNLVCVKPRKGLILSFLLHSTAGAAPPVHHPLMRLFDGDISDQYGSGVTGSTFNQITLPSSGSANWGSSADTLRPGSINIPEFDNADGSRAFAPAATPWFMAGATRVSGGFGLHDEDDESSPSRFGLAVDEGPEESDTIAIPSDHNGPGTIRPSSSNFLDEWTPNPFPKRGRQPSSDSVFNSGPFGGISSGPSLTASESASTDEWDFARSDSPEAGIPRSTVAQSPSLPSLTMRQEESPTALRRHISPRSLASRMRSNTAPNFDSAPTSAPSAEPSSAKNILGFAGRNPSPFAAHRPSNNRRPSALNLPESTSQHRLLAQEVSFVESERE